MSGSERGAWVRLRDGVVFLCTVGTSVSSLGNLTDGTTQVVLRIIAGLSSCYAMYLLIDWYRIVRRSDRVSAADYARDIEDVVTRQAAPNEEKVLVEIIVGRDDNEDFVKEEVQVEPNPQVVHRLIRPIMPDHWKMPRRLTDIDFECMVDDSDDGPVLVRRRPMRTRDYLQIWLIFVPTLTKATTWRFQYRPKGLWRRLRTTGEDRLVWHDTMPSHGRSPLVDFRIRFVFTDNHFKPRVSERNNFGVVTPLGQRGAGEWVIEWHDPSPHGRRYEWTIARTPRN